VPTLTAGDEPFSDGIVLYRAVALAEAADVQEHGFRLGPNTMPGKWFAGRLEDAERWGSVLHRMSGAANVEPFRVVSIRLPSALVRQIYHDPLLDGIGPAYFVAESQLPELNARGAIVSISAVLLSVATLVAAPAPV
jgi:hypothetical protein